MEYFGYGVILMQSLETVLQGAFLKQKKQQKQTPGILSEIHQQFLPSNVLFQRQVKKCQNQIKNSCVIGAIRDPI